jgi:hypothetical protein
LALKSFSVLISSFVKYFLFFEQTIYPITPYCEYLATSYLIDKNKKYLTNDDIKTLKDLSANPSDSYLLH